MLHLGFGRTWHFVLLAMCCCCAHHVTGQCVMEDKVGYQGADTGSTGVTDPIASFDDCKAYCLADDDCMAAEFRFSFACLVWNQDPQETVEAGSTIALKVCTPDPTGSNSSSLMPSEGTTSSSMEDQITSTRTATATATIVVCPHGVEEITGPKDYLEIDGGPSFGDDAFTENGWESTTQGGDTLTITFTGDDEKTLRQLSFVVKNGAMTQLSVLVETTPGNFAPPDFIDLQTNEQSYTRSFNTPVASISITTSETISRLAITICNETPDGGATSSTPVLQTSSIIMSSSATSTSSDSISPTQTTEPDGGDTSSASVRQTTVTEVIRTTMTSDMLSTSDIFTSSDLISSTVTVSVSATPTPTACTMVEMMDTDASNSATEYTLEGSGTCLSLCQNIVQCQHFIYNNVLGTCKLYVESSITSFYHTNRTLFSKRSCASGEPCCFDIDTNASSSDNPALIISPTANACKDFCLAFGDCQAAVYDGEKCKIIDTPATPLAKENVVLFRKECPADVQSSFTRTDVCSDGGVTVHQNPSMTVFIAGLIVTGCLLSLH